MSSLMDTPTARRLFDELAVLAQKVQDPEQGPRPFRRHALQLAMKAEVLLDLLTEDERAARIVEELTGP